MTAIILTWNSNQPIIYADTLVFCRHTENRYEDKVKLIKDFLIFGTGDSYYFKNVVEYLIKKGEEITDICDTHYDEIHKFVFDLATGVSNDGKQIENFAIGLLGFHKEKQAMVCLEIYFSKEEQEIKINIQVDELKKKNFLLIPKCSAGEGRLIDSDFNEQLIIESFDDIRKQYNGEKDEYVPIGGEIKKYEIEDKKIKESSIHKFCD